MYAMPTSPLRWRVLGAVATLALAAGCSLPADETSDSASDSQESASTGQMRVAFDETIGRTSPVGGDVTWYDAARAGVFALRRTGTGASVRWIESRYDAPTSTWIETANVAAAPTDPQGTQVGTDHAYVVGASGRLLDVDQSGKISAWSSGAWSARPAANAPPSRRQFALAYDVTRDRVVLFGGTAADTWEWDGASWARVATTGPAADVVPGSMVYDATRKKTVLGIGGRDTWVWDGISWTSTGKTTPANASRAPLVWNSDRSKIAFVAGNAMWEWNGSAWSSMPVRDGGYRQSSFLAQNDAYDRGRHRLVETGWGSGTTLTVDYEVTSKTNLAPEVATAPPSIAYAGDVFVLLPTARDADGDRVTFTITPVPAGARTAADGALVWTPPFDALGNHDFQVQASDGKPLGTGTGTARVTVAEPLFAKLLPRGAVANLGASMTFTTSVSTEWTNGSAGGSAGSTSVSVACTLAGDNPTGLNATCNVSGQITAGNSPGPFGFTATGRVDGRGIASLDYSTPGHNGRLTLTIRGSAAGATELAISDFFYSQSATFGITGWPGYVTLDQRSLPEASAPLHAN